MGYIYKITNDVNGKIYIGKTELPHPKDRWKEHLYDYKKERCKKRPLYRAMNKYGAEHFHFEVIEETDNPEEREKYWINELRTYVGFKDCNGYNATLGGDGKSYLNLDEDEVIKYYTENACYTIQETADYFNVDAATIRNILKKHNVLRLNTKDANNMRFYKKYGGVYQINVNCNMIYNIFINCYEAANFIKKHCDKNISACANNINSACNGTHRNHYAYGYLWYYGKDLHLIDHELINCT